MDYDAIETTIEVAKTSLVEAVERYEAEIATLRDRVKELETALYVMTESACVASSIAVEAADRWTKLKFRVANESFGGPSQFVDGGMAMATRILAIIDELGGGK